MQDRILIEISKNLSSANETVAVAESVTGGNIQSVLSLADKASAFFQGGIVAYNVGQKTRHLHIDPIHGLACNCISQKIASAMATNVCTSFLSDWGIGITGYASRVPGVDQLYAYYSIAYRDTIIKEGMLSADNNDAGKVQQYYTEQVLIFFNEAITKSDKDR
jgi:nicotinamide-nucleotide amidase